MKNYCQSCGVNLEAVPMVFGAFIGAKYVTWTMMIICSIRYRPLRCIFLARNQVLPSTHTILPGVRHQQLRFVEAWNRAQRHRSSASLRRQRRERLRASLGDAWIFAKKFSNAERKLLNGVASRRLVGRGLRDRNIIYRDIIKHHLVHWWRVPGRELLHQRQLTQQLRLRQNLVSGTKNQTWYTKLSAKYWKLSDKFVELTGKSRLWKAVGTNLRLEPTRFALGVAEGMIFYKLTFVLHAPLQFWLIVQFFKHRTDKNLEVAGSIGKSVKAPKPKAAKHGVPLDRANRGHYV